MDNKPTFSSEDIGTKTAKKQNLFASHQQQISPKKWLVELKKPKNLILLLAAVILIILVVALIIIFWPKTAENAEIIDNQQSPTLSTEEINAEINTLSDLATQEYNNGDTEAAEQTYTEALDDPANAEYLNQIKLSQMDFYYNTVGDFSAAIELIEQINPEKLTVDEQVTYYNLSANAVYENNPGLAAEYQEKAIEASMASGSGAGG